MGKRKQNLYWQKFKLAWVSLTTLVVCVGTSSAGSTLEIAGWSEKISALKEKAKNAVSYAYWGSSFARQLLSGASFQANLNSSLEQIKSKHGGSLFSERRKHEIGVDLIRSDVWIDERDLNWEDLCPTSDPLEAYGIVFNLLKQKIMVQKALFKIGLSEQAIVESIQLAMESSHQIYDSDVRGQVTMQLLSSWLGWESVQGADYDAYVKQRVEENLSFYMLGSSGKSYQSVRFEIFCDASVPCQIHTTSERSYSLVNFEESGSVQPQQMPIGIGISRLGKVSVGWRSEEYFPSSLVKYWPRLD